MMFRYFLRSILTISLLTGAFALWFFLKPAEKFSANPNISVTANKTVEKVAPLKPIKPAYSCAGKTKCPQMNSCKEALFYLNQCGVKRLDYDKDMIPCEKTHCSIKN
ncbi:MAG: excalibur calcium-binding domain-containing protein [Methylococcales bacterium]|nr:excalibur calcium-binding domain-containing protein [Methylococcales bacterium]